MDRLYSTFEIKSANEGEGIIEGIASTPTTDRQGDIVEPRGAEYRLPLPLCWQHDSHAPIGKVLAVKVLDTGIHIRALIARGVLPEIDRAWTLIKSGLVRGLSIGFQGLEVVPVKNAPVSPNPFALGGQHYKRWSWLELSVVTIPANAEANINNVKAYSSGPRWFSEGDVAKIRAETILNARKGLPVVRIK